jgi:hypothetical protein
MQQQPAAAAAAAAAARGVHVGTSSGRDSSLVELGMASHFHVLVAAWQAQQ